MLSIEKYDEIELNAIRKDPFLYMANRWSPVAESSSHLVWIKELKDLQLLLNRFQNDPSRYPAYLYELGGLSKDDLQIFLDARDRLIVMQERYYPELKPVVPVETLLSALAVYQKIKAARPNATTILEVGPGSGLNGVFFSRDSSFKNYTQIEATQATYFSQAMINETFYGEPNVVEASYQESLTFSARVWHIPWWRVKDLYGSSICYDVITANACLNEISNEIVNKYLELFNDKSHENTLLLIQDYGAPFYREEEDLDNLLNQHGWFLNDVLSNWDIESKIKANAHGDAVTTLWWTRCKDAVITRNKRRCEEGLSILNSDHSFNLPGETYTWSRSNLESVL